jgi:serine beta-lactamase-like protein LACTB, mitochondrial
MQLKTRFTFLLFLLLSASLGYTQGSFKNATRFIKSIQADSETVGLSVTVAKEGKIIYSKGFGYESLEHEVKVDPGKTKFRIASISKALTSGAMGVLMNRNRLDVDMPVQLYAPYFPKKNYKITSRQVAGHVAGIRHYRNNEFLSAKRYNSVKEGIEIFILDSLNFKPGTQYSYSSYGFNLVSAIIEGASGMEYLDFMQKEIFDPLKMKSTVPDYHDSIIAHRSDFYSMEKGKVIHARYVDNSYKWAGGGYLSTTEDLIKFGNAMLYDKLFPEEIKIELITSQKLSNGKLTHYGMGWTTGINKYGKTFYGHGGGAIGGCGNFLIFPEEKLVIAVYTNDTQAMVGSEIHDLANIFMESYE